MPIPDNSELISGKHIIGNEAEGYCPFCEKFRAKVGKNYLGDIPLGFRMASQLKGLEINSPPCETPTLLVLENGVEAFGYQGYLSPKEFYEALGYFKLGDSEAYKVAFQQGTEARFCKEYEIFKNTPDGMFVDKLSGGQLFDTNDRFNYSSVLLSFTAPLQC